jgi:mannose-1-phosphate guanylyltransferase
MAVLPADHYIGIPQAFCRCLESAIDAALQLDALVTVGITPRSPETGYGYIQYGEETGTYRGLADLSDEGMYKKVRSIIDQYSTQDRDQLDNDLVKIMNRYIQ